MSSSDTIVAVSTPAGVGGIAVVRLSGPDALAIAVGHLSVDTLAPRHATLCRFDDIDEVVALYFPKGYTCEPTVEFSCHGSLYVQRAVVEALVDSGARMAESGEFTLRAVRNGRLDLSQAEAVADLLDASTPAQHRLAISQLRGGYAQRLKEMRQQLLDLTSLLELELDFSQEDVEFADRHELRRLLKQLMEHVSRLVDSFALGNALKRGVPVAIAGEPNAGKSTLLNALLDDDRAIVSAVPGTTRDTIEEALTIGGVTFRLVDTAGIRQAADEVEALGVERSQRAVADATLVLCLHDCTQPWREPDVSLEGKKTIHILSKTDLPHTQPSVPHLSLSAKTGEGIEELKAAMVEAVGDMDKGDVLLTNARHREALVRMRQALANAAEGLAAQMPADLVAVDLRDALYHLGTVTGEVANDEILGNIFSRFCVGK